MFASLIHTPDYFSYSVSLMTLVHEERIFFCISLYYSHSIFEFNGVLMMLAKQRRC